MPQGLPIREIASMNRWNWLVNFADISPPTAQPRHHVLIIRAINPRLNEECVNYSSQVESNQLDLKSATHSFGSSTFSHLCIESSEKILTFARYFYTIQRYERGRKYFNGEFIVKNTSYTYIIELYLQICDQMLQITVKHSNLRARILSSSMSFHFSKPWNLVYE